MRKELSAKEFWHWLHSRINGVTPPQKSPLEIFPDPLDMEPLQPYRRSFSGGSCALCMYRRAEDEQAAFNEVYAALPADRDKFKAEWTFLPPLPDRPDPLSRCGYIGAKWKEENPDHLTARVWTRNKDGVVIPNDAYVHKDSVEAMRQDASYVYVDAPGNRDPRHATEGSQS